MFISGDSGFVEFNNKFEKTRLTLTRFRLLFIGEQKNNQVFLFERKYDKQKKFLLHNYTKPKIYIDKDELMNKIQGVPLEISCSDTGKYISISSNKGHFFIKKQNKKVIAVELKERFDKEYPGDPNFKIHYTKFAQKASDQSSLTSFVNKSSEREVAYF